MIEILETPSLNSIQDLGRKGQREHGINQSGALDSLALAAGNLLAGNEVGAAGIEVQLFPIRLKFHADTVVAVTGADCNARLEGKLLPPWWAVEVKAGQELALSHPRSGLRAYVAVAGGLDVPLVMGSRSTFFRLKVGGHEGRPLRAGDRLAHSRGSTPRLRDKAGFGVTPASIAMPMPQHDHAVKGDIVVRVMPSSEYGDYTAASHRSLWESAWTVTMQSNRMGYQLKGETLERPEALELRSRGIMPGVVQVPPGGQPIIQLFDGNSAGGYPQIGCVIEADLWRLAQAPPGSRLRFREASLAQARQAATQVRDYLERLRQQVRNCHDA